MEINCPNCNKALELPDNAVGVKVRCSFCRATFIGEEPAVSLSAPAGSGFKFCPNCGAKAIAGSNFCANCGHSFGGAKAARPSARTQAATVACAVCGRQVRESSAVRCSRCGKDVCKTHYDKKMDACTLCVIDIKDELAEKAVKTGLGGDWHLAFSLAKQADKNDPRILYVYAKAYQTRAPELAYHSWEYNRQKYYEYLASSAAAGYAIAQYEEGHGQMNFEVRGLPWLLKAAEQEYVPAQMEIAQKYREGFKGKDDALVKNTTIAFKWYKRAADNGDAEACYRVAVSYITANGVAFDAESGLMWLRRSANQGNAAALSLLGHYYRLGRFVERDSYKALECYISAADKGNDIARKYVAKSVVRSKYIVVDLTGGLIADRFPIHEFDDEGAPTIDSDRWPEVYKTRYLLLRKIEPGECVNQKGQIIRIVKPFYLGVFPVTQYQWEMVMGSRPSYFSNESFYKMRPVESVSYASVRGHCLEYDLSKSLSVDEKAFLGVLRRKTSLEFELPTPCQWEYACRAGSTCKYYNGYDLPNTIARYGGELADNNSKKNCDLSDGTMTVGSFCPNRWGLYDMLGNVNEYCRDACAARLRKQNVDLIGSNNSRVDWRVDVRGGCWYSCEGGVTSSSWFNESAQSGGGSSGVGFRVSLEFVEWDCPEL